MPDDDSKRGPADNARINIKEQYEVRYWAKKFDCSEARLLEAVKAMGRSAPGVEKFLRATK